jgi:hypothetical protein
MTSIDPAPWVIERWERKQAEREARENERLHRRFLRLFSNPRCPVCGAMTALARQQRCKGACRD